MTIVAIWLPDRMSRRGPLMTATCGMAVGLTTLAPTFLVGGSTLTGGAAIVARCLHRLVRPRGVGVRALVEELCRPATGNIVVDQELPAGLSPGAASMASSVAVSVRVTCFLRLFPRDGAQ